MGDAKLKETISILQKLTILKSSAMYVLAHKLHPSILPPSSPRWMSTQFSSGIHWTGRGEGKGTLVRRMKGLLCKFPLCLFTPFGVGWLISLGHAFTCTRHRGAQGWGLLNPWRASCGQGKQVVFCNPWPLTYLFSLNSHKVSHVPTLFWICCSLPLLKIHPPNLFLLA